MSHDLREGVKLKSVLWGGDSEIGYIVGQADVESITVAMQVGQMGMVPWAKVVIQNGDTALINLAQVDSVDLEKADG